MKVASLAIALMSALAFQAALAAPPSSLKSIDTTKNSTPTGVPNPVPQVGGENIATAKPITALPYSDTGNTCGYINDYDETCPYTGSLSPDVVYSFTPPVNMMISIHLCYSYYDTKVYVYQNYVSPGDPYACNDDACSGPNYPQPWLSELDDCLLLHAGNTYYIVVDGYGSSCGEYVLDVYEALCGCPVPCPPGGIAEGEPDCHSNYLDQYNGGCNSDPPVFSNVPCSGMSLTLCGSYGGFLYNGLSYRDTDWYELVVPPGGFDNVSICGIGQYPTILGIIDGNAGCPVSSFVDFVSLSYCEYGCINAYLPPGNTWIWVGTSGFGPDYPCGGDYRVEIDGLVCPVTVRETSWAEIKAGYGE